MVGGNLTFKVWFGQVYGVYRHFQQYYSYIVTVSFIGEGNRSTRGKSPIYRKSLTNFITWCCIDYTSPLKGFELTTLVVIGIDFTCSCKSNYHTITTTTGPIKVWTPKHQPLDGRPLFLYRTASTDTKYPCFFS